MTTNNTENAMFENLQHDFGVGNGRTTACVNSLAYLIYAEQQGTSREEALTTLTDNVSCICPVISRLSIRINDRRAFWPDHDEATRWMHETAPRLLGTRGSVETMRKRAFLCADAAIREIAPVCFDLAAEKWTSAKEWAEKLRACESGTDTRTARAAQRVAQEARKDAYAAADAAAYAAAYAYADAAAYADAYAAADAYAYAYAAADAYAYAYAAADADAYAAKILKPIMLALLDRCLAVTE